MIGNLCLFRIDDLLNQKVDTPTIIGVVGNTGAGKSSVINAMLEEERLVPTNCMRACTAVVTEMSWNSSEDENEKYRAHIEFIRAADWERDLRISLTELIDGNGQVCNAYCDCGHTNNSRCLESVPTQNQKRVSHTQRSKLYTLRRQVKILLPVLWSSL